MGKAIVFSLAAWGAPLLAALLTTGVIAGATQKLGASAVGPWMMLAIALQLVLFAGASVVLFRLLGRTLEGGARVGLFVAHSFVQLGLFGMVAFGTLVAFNR